MDKYSIMIGLGLCIGYIYLKNTTIKFMNIQRIDINEINSFLTKDELEHVKRISNMIADDEVEFLDDEEFKSLIHSVVGES